MHAIHKILDWFFATFPSLREFCFLALPIANTNDLNSLYNAPQWNEYLDNHPNAPNQLREVLDSVSIRWVGRLLLRRKTNRYFLTPSEIIRYYKAKHLSLRYWFPKNGTLLKSVFVCKAGTCYIPPHNRSVLKNRLAVDGGAASGDSSIALLEAGASEIMAFEPSPRQRAEMSNVFSKNNLSARIKIIPYALSESRQEISFNDQYCKSFTAQTISIDEICEDKDIGCIKLDIEGAEFPTIRGAAKTIQRCRPALLICVYHRPEDLFELPLWIHAHFPFYKIRIRETEPGNYGVGAHLMLIAWPSDNKAFNLQ